jgi:hypothetical protein
LWLALLLTVPFSLSALSNISNKVKLDTTHARLDFPPTTPSLTQQVAYLAIPLMSRPGKDGSYAALVLARLYSRPDTMILLPAFFDWAEVELREGDRDGEANFVAGLLELLALLPGMIAVEYLDSLKEFRIKLVDHLKGSRTSVSSGLIRKLAVKASGRWWMAKLAGSQGV